MKRLRKILFCSAGILIAAFLLFSGLTACSADPNRYLVTAQPGQPILEVRETLSVISYNIQARPVLDSCAWKSVRIGERLKEYDLIGLQETFHAHDLLFEKNSVHGEVYFGKRRHFLKLVNSGLAILSRYPIEEVKAEYFEDEGSLENRFGSKGVLMARIRINGSVLDFYTTHLAAGSPGVSGEAREDELRQIAGFIRRNSPSGNAVIINGDFNLTLRSKQKELRNFLAQTGLSNPAKELNCEKKTFIDHIFYRSGSTLKLKPRTWKLLKQEFTVSGKGPLSDHHPLLVEFDLTSEKNRQEEWLPRQDSNLN